MFFEASIIWPYTKLPTLRFGLFRLVAPSKLNAPNIACTGPPMSTRKYSEV